MPKRKNRIVLVISAINPPPCVEAIRGNTAKRGHGKIKPSAT